jgi:RHH-type proline utilization regulon transcriptional repressor/proline dehydrogenase/delta 1-pyrroline-5-carboxylate dehydrogenase
VEIGKQEAKLAFGGEVPAGLAGRPYVAPHVFAVERYEPGRPPRIATEEIFGPVLAVIRVKDLDEALAIANSSNYKLTGGCFSRTPSTIERVRREFRVGNLYVNRGITGALVSRQPFGGFGLSGVGSKAGGPDYLRQFVDTRVCTENTMRRGFVPAGTSEGGA